MQSTSRPAGKLGDLVRKASKHKGPWPKVSVWHGSADRTVNPGNANEIVKQWLDVHGLPAAPMSAVDVDGHPREVWWNADGETVVKSYTITDMAHGTPLGLAGNDEPYGAEGAFLIEAGISSSYHIADFFGLTERVNQPAKRPSRCRRRSRSVRCDRIPAVVRSRCHALVEVPQAGSPTQASAARTQAPRHRCRRRHHPRPDGRGTDEIAASAFSLAN